MIYSKQLHCWCGRTTCSETCSDHAVALSATHQSVIPCHVFKCHQKVDRMCNIKYQRMIFKQNGDLVNCEIPCETCWHLFTYRMNCYDPENMLSSCLLRPSLRTFLDQKVLLIIFDLRMSHCDVAIIVSKPSQYYFSMHHNCFVFCYSHNSHYYHLSH